MRILRICTSILLVLPAGREHAKATEPISRTGALRLRELDSPAGGRRIGVAQGGFVAFGEEMGAEQREANRERPDSAARNRAILAKLEMPITLKYPDLTPLERVVSDIAKATKGPNDSGIPIHVDPIGLKMAEKTMTAPIRLDLEGVPLKTILRLLLKELGMDYYVEDGRLIISDGESVEARQENAGCSDTGRVSGTLRR